MTSSICLEKSLFSSPDLLKIPARLATSGSTTFAHFLIFLYFRNLKIYLYFVSGVHIKRYSNFYSFNLLVLGIKEKTDNCKEIEVWGADHGL